eukprot:TRINITY_DN7594_c0_g2_i1.p1 TRINITY_DN7594_c0_g2~~TRINITY_DN7594_c0_g2_i1.p1  ORF type:complete len:709 (+),score=249.52 TRINITY_DN7594_c0_g2_i1:66-2192(+)
MRLILWLQQLSHVQDEPAVDRRRKDLMVPMMACFAVVIIVKATRETYDLVNWTEDKTYNQRATFVLYAVANVIALLSLIPALVYVLYTRRITLGLCEFSVLGSVAAVIIGDAGFSLYSESSIVYINVVMLDALLVCQCRQSVAKVVVAVTAAWMFVRAVLMVEDVAGACNDSCVERFSGGYFARALTGFALQTSVFVADFHFTRGFAVSMAEQKALVEASVLVSEQAAVLLSMYETGKTLELLDGPDGESLPPLLRSALLQLVGNLAVYRPYLPQSCLPDGDSRASDGAGAAELLQWQPGSARGSASICGRGSAAGDEAGTAIWSSCREAAGWASSGEGGWSGCRETGRWGSGEAVGGGGGGSSADGSMRRSDDRTDRSGGPASGLLPATALSPQSLSVRSANAAALSPEMSPTRHLTTASSRRASSRLGSLPSSPLSARLASKEVLPRKVSLVTVNARSFLSSCGDPDRTAVQVYRDIADFTWAVAAERGVVDWVSGDHLSANFNAARMCTTHRASAARAAWSVAGEGTKRTAAASSGAVLCGDFGTPELRRFMLLGAVFNTLQCLERVAAQLGAVLIDETVGSDADFGSSFFTALIERLTYPKRGEKPFFVWQVVGRRESASGPEEWLYELQRQAASPHSDWNMRMYEWLRFGAPVPEAELERMVTPFPAVVLTRQRQQSVLREAGVDGETVAFRAGLPAQHVWAG